MAIERILTDASSAMTVISLITFIGILCWAFSSRRKQDFAEAAQLPFADDEVSTPPRALAAQDESEPHHG